MDFERILKLLGGILDEERDFEASIWRIRATRDDQQRDRETERQREQT